MKQEEIRKSDYVKRKREREGERVILNIFSNLLSTLIIVSKW